MAVDYIIELLWFDGDGRVYSLSGWGEAVIWPQAAEGTISLTAVQLSLLLEGIDWRRPEENLDAAGSGVIGIRGSPYPCGFYCALSRHNHGKLRSSFRRRYQTSINLIIEGCGP
jgi:hypothetical protein